MKAFFAALLGVLAAGVLWVALVSILRPTDIWRWRPAPETEWLQRNGGRSKTATAAREALQVQQQRWRADREHDELQEQRRERLALLSATLRTTPIARLAPAEMHLFQQAERERARAANGGQFVRLLGPVQIDEWTVLQRGTAVEFVRAERDNVITIRHDGARYQLSPCQTELRAISGDLCQE